MEQLLHYCWNHKLFPLGVLTTTDGQLVEVIDTGLYNRNAGPDFFNAKIKIGGTIWVGNVEIHDKSSDWYLHGHHHDPHYDNVILHVATLIDADVKTSLGRDVPQLRLDVPDRVRSHYRELITTDQYPPCYKIIPTLTQLMVHSWMSTLQTERLEQKTTTILDRVKRCGGSWASAYFVTLARNYGFGINGDAFEAWALNIPLASTAHHRDNLFQIEAFFFGQAGLLELNSIPQKYQKEALNEGYFSRLRSEYQYLAHKFQLKPIDVACWRFLRLRPQNFPHIRISQLAHLYCSRRAGLDKILECATVIDIMDLLHTQVTPYWETHYTFGSISEKNEKHLSPFSLNLLMINTVIPILFAYGRYHGNEILCDRAFDFLEQLKAENNYIVRMWKECGLDVQCAGDSQALIQLKKEYCDKRDCLRCRIGYEYLKMK
ncbi:MAG: DUF2851 family protein [Prevotella sp.]|jgi:hypothetical protein|nr:DUF2851 family protein [Prevotella sp.]MCI2080806.1 DUF2851 family protein [Prevotella sp.]MCI2102717.1 DUF2851 family protein [Prevotella sp.]HCN52816.1 DUF2851 domain-containing protein [Prevotella sp.]